MASKILILFCRPFFFLICSTSLWIFKRFPNLEFWLILEPCGCRNSTVKLRLWVKHKKVHPTWLTPLVLLIFNLPCQLLRVITFEWVISLRWNFWGNVISYISFIWKSFIRIRDWSCRNLRNFVPVDMEWPKKLN